MPEKFSNNPGNKRRAIRESPLRDNKEVRDKHGLLYFVELCLELRYFLEEGCGIIRMCSYGYGREEIKREDTHYGLRIDNVSALHEVNLKVHENNQIYKLSNLLNGKELNLRFLHQRFSFDWFYEYIIPNYPGFVNRNKNIVIGF